jgi:lysozyme family protein
MHEGGPVDHPKDTGGRTNKGITQPVYGLAPASVARGAPRVHDLRHGSGGDLPLSVLAADSCDALPAGVGYVVMDGAVNFGPKQSAKWLQRALGVGVDGDIGNDHKESCGAEQPTPSPLRELAM